MADEYVIIEFNQASHQPRILHDDIYDNYVDAVEDAGHAWRGARKVGRRERYVVARIDIEWDSDEAEMGDR